MITAKQILALSPHAAAPIVGAIVSHVDALAAHRIDTPRRIQHFFAQAAVESAGFTRLEENLSYSAERLVQVWPSRFRSLTAARACAHNPQALANVVYAGRMGNVGSDDGWLFRGKGLLQTTGRNNTAKLAGILGVSAEIAAAWLTDPEHMMVCAAATFVLVGALAAADRDDVNAVTRAVNGGVNALPARVAALKTCKAIFKDGLRAPVAPPSSLAAASPTPAAPAA